MQIGAQPNILTSFEFMDFTSFVFIFEFYLIILLMYL